MMIVIVTGFIPFTAVHCFHNGYVGKQPVAWKECCADYWLKELQESMDRCTGRHDITEILFKTTLNTIQSIIRSCQKTLIFCKQPSIGTRIRCSCYNAFYPYKDICHYFTISHMTNFRLFQIESNSRQNKND